MCFQTSGVEINPCLIISAYPERKFSLSNVFRNWALIITLSAGLMTPISFFSPLKLMPVFPPTAASTLPRRVVGMLMYSMPRLKVDAANPPRSVTIPPPRLIKNDFREAPLLLRKVHTSAMLWSDLLSSPAGISIIFAWLTISSPKRERQFLWVLESTRMKSPLVVFPFNSALTSAWRSWLIMIFCCAMNVICFRCIWVSHFCRKFWCKDRKQI